METTYRPGYDGSGPGDITPDGCAVDRDGHRSPVAAPLPAS